MLLLLLLWTALCTRHYAHIPRAYALAWLRPLGAPCQRNTHLPLWDVCIGSRLLLLLLRSARMLPGLHTCSAHIAGIATECSCGATVEVLRRWCTSMRRTGIAISRDRSCRSLQHSTVS